MKNSHKIIIALIVLVLITLVGIAMFATGNMVSYKTMTFSDTRTSMEVPQSMELKTNLDQDGMKLETYATDNGAIQVERRVVNDSQIEDALNDTVEAKYTRTVSNNTTCETFVIASLNGENETVDHIADSIKWGKKANYTSKVNANASANSTNSSSASGNSDKTYPFYGDTGDLIGYYHVGDTVSFKDYIFQLQSNGEWVMIGEATGSDQQGYESGYQSATDDMESNGGSQSESQSSSSGSESSSSSSSADVETTVDKFNF